MESEPSYLRVLKLEEEKTVTRKEQILLTLASMLEESPGSRITTARLAKQVGVSEAALYRHFPSKTKMFETLLEFIEETVFSRISVILGEEDSTLARTQQIIHLLLTFSERNPGITRLLTGDPLSGEPEHLRTRVNQFFDRFETQLKQVLREGEIRDGQKLNTDIQTAANLLLSCTEGKISHFVRSNFKAPPTKSWNEQWKVLRSIIFHPGQ
ncbi:MAG: nucleoid occlusion factor SlmA [Gammaproteobacteria bacterium TMED1]|nr:MAG: nucleoid occlusion factor SlmA [Gammaproteobacteria bacterium TMED1]